jgi:hypothetical protein
MTTHGTLVSGRLSQQLSDLAVEAQLSTEAHGQLTTIFELLTSEALDRPIEGAYPGLASVNASGLPFQWSLCVGDRPSVRFLCESGVPGTSPQERLHLSIERLEAACVVLGLPGLPDWFAGDVLAYTVPNADSWPAHWRSAFWTGVGAAGSVVMLKPYLNLNRDSPIERWRRIGWLLKALGRDEALERLCAISGTVSTESWPVGVAVDIAPTGEPGRLKVYFRSGAVTRAWLETWYTAVQGEEYSPRVRELLDAFPFASQRYPDRFFFLSLESHPDGASLTIKVDLAVTGWRDNDRDLVAATGGLLDRLGLDASALHSYLRVLGVTRPSAQSADLIRLVGLGYEPDGSTHVNIYLEPPLNVRDEPASIKTQNAKPSVESALARGLRWLVDSRHDSHWADYELPVGRSNRWVTAYVLCQLAHVPPSLSTSALRRSVAETLIWLEGARTRHGGWGYNDRTSDDADSTGLSVLALRAHERPVPSGALGVLRRCVHEDGGVSTYPPGSVPGGSWTMPVADVTTTAALALEGDIDPTVWLESQQLSSGLWTSFWWTTSLYATVSAIAWLSRASNSKPDCLDTTRVALSRYVASGSFERALLTTARSELHLCRSSDYASELCDEQHHDGSWGPAAFLRLTNPDCPNPADVIDGGRVFVDTDRVLTTSTSIGTLARLVGPGSP